jgi:hypothetical protein
LEAGWEALTRAMGASWWGWDAGSALFFWRWPKEFCGKARNGTPVHIAGQLPWYCQPQRLPGDSFFPKRLFDKIDNVRAKGYIKPGLVWSLTSYFGIPKGKRDI